MEIYETQREIAQRKSWLLSLVVIVLVSFGVLIVLQGIALGLVPFLFGIGLEDIVALLSGDFSVPNGRMALYFVQGLGSGIGFMVAGYIISSWIDKANLRWDIQLSRTQGKKILITVFLTFGAMLFNALLVYLNAQMELPEALSGLESWMKEMEKDLMEMTMFLTDFQNIKELLMGILVIGVFAGLGEELFFRGVLQPKMHLYTGSYHWGIWLTAAIFSAIHMQFYGFLPRLFLGALFGYLYVYSGSLVYPILAHIFNNSFTVLLVYASAQGWIEFDLESTDTVSYPAALLGLLVLSAGFYYFKKTKPSEHEGLDQSI
ncbi:CPBP family intramembrane metalloprotease [Algoriphagus kandeliae]|uniref:CPBP family intramembrane metalloprotease n=1 Tax=Algoriphagus kandeliae TaxID=2562278 RepID=A0A4Y9QU67_9BACT|nr:type II CAAX endopeptidase family protein [Algoriphagus kandeliae]TFV96141.1 CPBP family intramembrane metalloprotease [Algoriphagus kandeliae]